MCRGEGKGSGDGGLFSKEMGKRITSGGLVWVCFMDEMGRRVIGGSLKCGLGGGGLSYWG